jgi:DNA polymerase-3 subunit alpha
LSTVFSAFQGDHQVSFEILETEKMMVKSSVKNIKIDLPEAEIDVDVDEDSELENNFEIEIPIDVVTETEEIIVKTKLSMNSRKVKVNICHELLQQLEKVDLSFRLN